MDSNSFDSLNPRLPKDMVDISYDNYQLDKIIEKTKIKIQPNKKIKELRDDQSIQNEYSILQNITDYDENHIKKLSKDSKKNRYTDIRTYEYNKVPLESKEYINASFIDIPNKKYFISTQGPIESTINDFWEMIFEYDCKIILMLCNEIEGGRKKCAEYWKAKKISYQIEYKEDIKQNLIIRDIRITKDNVSKNVIQIQYKGWPDHGIPKIEEAYESFLFMIQYIIKTNSNSPVVCHCSAGVGRTGTFLTLFNLYVEIERKKNNPEIQFNIFNVVRKLKEMRMLLVQTDTQYWFIYKYIETYLKKLFKKKI